MGTFLSILFSLLAINGLLLVFSVNGAMDRFRKPFRKISEGSAPKFLPLEESKTQLKKAS